MAGEEPESSLADLLKSPVALLIGFIAAVAGLVVFFTGKNLPDLLPSGSPPTSIDSAEGVRGKLLTPDSPVRVLWTGSGDAIEAVWSAEEYPELHSYSVDVYGLAPLETWYNVGYRFGQELRTTATTNPLSETNEKFADEGSAQRVDFQQTWRVCVTAMREVPGGASVEPYIIEGSRRCSDIFTIPR